MFYKYFAAVQLNRPGARRAIREMADEIRTECEARSVGVIKSSILGYDCDEQ